MKRKGEDCRVLFIEIILYNNFCLFGKSYFSKTNKRTLGLHCLQRHWYIIEYLKVSHLSIQYITLLNNRSYLPFISVIFDFLKLILYYLSMFQNRQSFPVFYAEGYLNINSTIFVLPLATCISL